MEYASKSLDRLMEWNVLCKSRIFLTSTFYVFRSVVPLNSRMKLNIVIYVKTSSVYLYDYRCAECYRTIDGHSCSIC